MFAGRQTPVDKLMNETSKHVLDRFAFQYSTTVIRLKLYPSFLFWICLSDQITYRTIYMFMHSGRIFMKEIPCMQLMGQHFVN